MSEAAARSWVPVAPGSDFPLENLPYGIFARPGEHPRAGVAIGAFVLDLGATARVGLLDAALPQAARAFDAPSLNGLLERGAREWAALRARIGELLRAGNDELRERGIAESALVPQAAVRLELPFAVADYVDFYASLDHASNAGKILRPGTPPLPPNWRWLPVGYHGRAASVAVDGTPVARPSGQSRPAEGEAPPFGASAMLDFELELGYVTGCGPNPPRALGTEEARELIFGVVLLNDWSARDLQAWEGQPLGPLLAKSFATSISPWVVPLAALEPFRIPSAVQEPPPLPHLATRSDDAYDIELEVALASETMRAGGAVPATIVRSNARHLYWSPAQQLAHLSSNGSRLRAGDLFGTGTISGPEPASFGSMLELTWRGERPLALPDGTRRAFLADGDEVIMRAWCERPGATRIGLGSVSGRVIASA